MGYYDILVHMLFVTKPEAAAWRLDIAQRNAVCESGCLNMRWTQSLQNLSLKPCAYTSVQTQSCSRRKPGFIQSFHRLRLELWGVGCLWDLYRFVAYVRTIWDLYFRFFHFPMKLAHSLFKRPAPCLLQKKPVRRSSVCSGLSMKILHRVLLKLQRSRRAGQGQEQSQRILLKGSKR